MGYVETILQPGESVRFKTNYHWVAFIPCLALLVLAVLSYWWSGRPNTWYGLWITLAVLLLAGAIILLVRAGYQRWITEIAVTDLRVIYKTGLLTRLTDEMPLGKVENIEITQSILGRALDYGTVDVQGTGAIGIGSDKLRRIASPLEFRDHVLVGA
ncbi:MAG: PH domain-containing protein [Rhodoplanes sp.]